jgi:trk system potassium uptake protein
MIRKKISAKFLPGRTILFALVSSIVVGTLLLSLPCSQNVPVSLLDTFFTATSVTCVTGLLTVPLTDFTPFGHGVILILMQIGGLGLVTMSLFLVSLFFDLGFGTQIIAGQLMEFESFKNIKQILKFIISFTFIGEAIGACILFLLLLPHYQVNDALFHAVFLSVSAFCNAGLTLFVHGMTGFQHSPGILVTLFFLMLFGGIGFITLHELFSYAAAIRAQKRCTLSLHSKIVLYSTCMIFCCSALVFWSIEQDSTITHLQPINACINTLFNALSVKSTGFLTVAACDLHFATLLMIMIVAFIGSAPGSTGSGIKTTTFAIFIATIKTAIMGRASVEIRGRKIPLDQVYKALAIISLSAAWIILTTFCILITDPAWEFLDILFEVVSAFATLGISLGTTPYLSTMGKFFIILTMIVGRVGSLTLVIAFKKPSDVREFSYPEERVILN